MMATPGASLLLRMLRAIPRMKWLWGRSLLGINKQSAAVCKQGGAPPHEKFTHRGARTHDHKVKGLALYRLS